MVEAAVIGGFPAVIPDFLPEFAMILNFMPQFVEPIRGRTKLHTLRRPRRDGKIAQPGETLHLWTGLRRPGAYRIVDPLPCSRSMQICLLLSERAILIRPQIGAEAYSWVELCGSEAAIFAVQDGFSNLEEFWQHWVAQKRVGSQIRLNLIGWRAEDVR